MNQQLPEGDRFAIPFHETKFVQSVWKDASKVPPARNVDFFRKYTSWKSRGGASFIFDVFESALPLFVEAKKLARHLRGHANAYRCVEFCRHKLVHSEGTFTAEDLSVFSGGQRQWMGDMTRKSLLSGREMFMPSVDRVRDIATMQSELLLLLHRALTNAFDMEEDFCTPRHLRKNATSDE